MRPDRKKGNKVAYAIIIALVLIMTTAGCTSRGSYKSTGGNKSYGAGGYEMPNSNDKSFSDYVKRVAPDVYNGVKNRYDSLK